MKRFPMRRWMYLAATVPMAALLAAPGLVGATQAATHAAQPLVLYEAEGYSTAVAQAFTRATHIPVEVVHMPTGPLLAKIQAERSNPHWDLAWSDGAATMQTLDDEGLLLRNWKPVNSRNYSALGLSLVPHDEAYHPTGLTAAVAIGYDTRVMKRSQVPDTFAGLLAPDLRREVAMNNPSISGPAYPFVAGIMQVMGMKRGEAYFMQLKEHGLQVYEKNPVTLRAMLDGRVKLALVQDTALISDQAKGDPVGIVYLKSGSFMLPGELVIDRRAPQMEEAKRFVEFVLSAAGQRVMLNPKNGGGDSYFDPIIRGERPDSLAARARMGIHWVKVNALRAGAEEPSLLKWFTSHILY